MLLYISKTFIVKTIQFELESQAKRFKILKEVIKTEMSFKGKVIIVTGASSGIGQHVSIYLASLGGKISLVCHYRYSHIFENSIFNFVQIGRNEKRLNQVVKEIKSAKNEAFGIVADVTKDAQRIIDETIKHYGQLDILINNAGR